MSNDYKKRFNVYKMFTNWMNENFKDEEENF